MESWLSQSEETGKNYIFIKRVNGSPQPRQGSGGHPLGRTVYDKLWSQDPEDPSSSHLQGPQAPSGLHVLAVASPASAVTLPTASLA